MENTHESDYYTVSELAQIFRVSKKTVYKYIKLKKIPHYMAFGKILVDKIDTENFMKQGFIKSI